MSKKPVYVGSSRGQGVGRRLCILFQALLFNILKVTCHFIINEELREITCMGKQGFWFSQVNWQSTPPQKAAVLVLCGVRAMS